ncbi:Peptidase A1 [Corchorus olitorius]|uniref:Peptidase A1 n=1 Tax=Corchorus olitorius TaxID=93759 RepID=A0A1R3IRZ5_9ROSI|nr:Peptidase A1 [Corchorus olitorius]
MDSLLTGGLAEDVMHVYSTNGVSVDESVDVTRFPFACANSDHLVGLAKGTEGMIGLSRAQIALPTQLSFKLNIAHLSKLLITTPLIINPVSTAPISSQGDHSDEYFINVKSIKVGGKFVSNFNPSSLSISKKGVGRTKISTITPYTVLHSAIYKALVKEFVTKAKALKAKQVKSVAPFGACFDPKTIRNSKTGLAVPDIDLVLHSSRVVIWRIYGHNSMVKVKRNVMCLGFVDGGCFNANNFHCYRRPSNGGQPP